MSCGRLIILCSRGGKHFGLRNGNNHTFKCMHQIRNCTSKVTSDQTAGLIVIGDEILKGQVVDDNTNFIAKGLYALGVKLVKVSVVGDNVEDISHEVKNFSGSFTFVITTGGIGPTHDDVTYEAVARAVDEPLYPHPELVKICQDFFKTHDLDAPALKLALIPKSGVLNYGYDKKKGIRTLYPIVSVHNVYIFPGVSQLMKNSFSLLCNDLFGERNKKFYLKEMFLAVRETEIANDLNKVVSEYPLVNFGSYPNFFNSYYGVKVTVESVDAKLTEDAYQKLKSLIPEGLLVHFDVKPLDHAYEKIQSLLGDITYDIGYVDNTIKQSIKNSLNILEECARKFSPNDVRFCFSGGKGSTVLLHLWYAVLSHHSPETSIKAVWFKDGESKMEVNAFVEETEKRYGLDLVTIEDSMRKGLKGYLSCEPHIKALILGVRSGDVESGLFKDFMKREPGEPLIESVCPIMTWNYGDIWNFLRSLNLPYCSLYDVGYTSVGSSDDTSPNPKLASSEVIYSLGARRGSSYYPAYKLTDWESERLKKAEK